MLGFATEAETLLLTLIEAPGATSASTIGSINAMLQVRVLFVEWQNSSSSLIFRIQSELH